MGMNPLYLTTAANLTGSYVSFSRPNNNGTSTELFRSERIVLEQASVRA